MVFSVATIAYLSSAVTLYWLVNFSCHQLSSSNLLSCYLPISHILSCHLFSYLLTSHLFSSHLLSSHLIQFQIFFSSHICFQLCSSWTLVQSYPIPSFLHPLNPPIHGFLLVSSWFLLVLSFIMVTFLACILLQPHYVAKPFQFTTFYHILATSLTYSLKILIPIESLLLTYKLLLKNLHKLASYFRKLE